MISIPKPMYYLIVFIAGSVMLYFMVMIIKKTLEGSGLL